MVLLFERHHAWQFPCMVPAGFAEMAEAGGASGSWRLHLV